MTEGQLPAVQQESSTPKAAGAGDMVTVSWSEPPIEPLPPRRRTPSRLQFCFLRHFARTGSQAEAAARTGITPRTVQRWRSTNPRFAERYETVIEQRREMLEDRAMQRAFSIDRRSMYRCGQPFAVVERYNDTMLMRVLGRFDRVHERTPPNSSYKYPEDLDLTKYSNAELAEMSGVAVPPGMSPADAIIRAWQHLNREVDERVKRLSPSKRQENPDSSGQ